MNEWNKLYESVPPLDTPVWAGWFNTDGSFTSGIFVLADNGVDNICIGVVALNRCLMMTLGGGRATTVTL
jgi:hypothetical protein